MKNSMVGLEGEQRPVEGLVRGTWTSVSNGERRTLSPAWAWSDWHLDQPPVGESNELDIPVPDVCIGC